VESRNEEGRKKYRTGRMLKYSGFKYGGKVQLCVT